MKLVTLALQMCFSNPRPVLFKLKKNFFPYNLTLRNKYNGLKWNAATDYSKLLLHIEKLYTYVDSMSL